jgi:serine/threonine protein kinase
MEGSKKESIEKEIEIFKCLDHPHIVKYYNYFNVDGIYYISMEYIEHGNMLDYVMEKVRLDEATVRSIFVQLVSALEYCHGNLIAHRDLKLENILISANKNKTSGLKVKLADFGLANFIKLSSLHRTYCGSLEYTPPEILREETYNPLISDIWGLGICLFAMLYGCFT